MSTPLEKAWEEYGGVLPTGRSNKANCPLHEDHTASAVLDAEKGKWRCFAGCGHGDVYDLIGLAEGEPEFHVQRRIALKFGDVQSPLIKTKKRPGRKGAWVPPWLR